MEDTLYVSDNYTFTQRESKSINIVNQVSSIQFSWQAMKGQREFKAWGVLRFELDKGVPLEPQNPYPSLRVILAEKGTHF